MKPRWQSRSVFIRTRAEADCVEKGGRFWGEEDGQPPRLGGWGSSLLGEECCGFPIPGDPGEQSGCLLIRTPQGFPLTAHRKIFQCWRHIRSLQDVCFLAVCDLTRTHTLQWGKLPAEVLCFDREGERRRGVFFFCLWKMEASFMTHVPCPPVKITPAVFQGCSIIGRAANENNGACGEETKQTQERERKTSSWTEIPAAGFETYTSSEGAPLSLLLEKRAFSGAITTGNLPARWRHFVLLQEGLLGQAQQRCINAWTHRVWADNRAQICDYILRRGPPPGRSASALIVIVKHTIELSGERRERLVSARGWSLEDESAGNAEVAVLWGPSWGSHGRARIVCLIRTSHRISAQEGLRGGRLSLKAGEEGQGMRPLPRCKCTVTRTICTAKSKASDGNIDV